MVVTVISCVLFFFCASNGNRVTHQLTPKRSHPIVDTANGDHNKQGAQDEVQVEEEQNVLFAVHVPPMGTAIYFLTEQNGVFCIVCVCVSRVIGCIGTSGSVEWCL